MWPSAFVNESVPSALPTFLLCYPWLGRLMSGPGPLQLALRSLWQRPSLVLAETAWRCLYLLVAAAVLLFAFLQVLPAADVSPAALTLAGINPRFLIPVLLVRTLPLFARASLVLVPALALLWVGTASVSRTAILATLVAAHSPATGGIRPCWPGIIGIHLLRALFALAAGVSCVGALWLCFSLIPAMGSQQAPVAALLLYLIVVLLIWLAWIFVDWFLRLAPIFSVRDRRGPWTAFARVRGSV